jgi:hypothetical protein
MDVVGNEAEQGKKMTQPFGIELACVSDVGEMRYARHDQQTRGL